MIKVLDSVSVPFWGYIFSNKPKMTNPLTPEEFPSPTVVLYSLIVYQDGKEVYYEKFPSPTGVIYSLIQLKKEVLIMISVSVLFWGYIFSNICTRKRICIQLLFPSPTGVLYSLIVTINNVWCDTDTFPSPTGVLYSLNLNMVSVQKVTQNRFPSPTGVLYSLIIYVLYVIQLIQFPSPTGVLYSLICTIQSQCPKAITFPSPTGVLYSLILSL